MIHKEKIKSEDPRLARHIYHDDRSWNYKLDTSKLEIKDVEHKRLIPVLNQGQLGSCTGNAGIGAINTNPFQLNNKVFSPNEDGAIKLYSDATKIDRFGGHYPPKDTGSSGLAIAKVLKSNELISEYNHTFTLNDALKALTVYPLIVGIKWHKDMYYPDPDGRVHPRGAIVGGHEVQAFKINKEDMKVWFYNSWGENWGVNGTFYLTWADLAFLLSEQGDVIALIPPKKKVAPKKKYKYFVEKEIVGLKTELVDMLDKARGIAGTPFIITSGFRTVAHNKEVGGVDNSSHTKGLAADLKVTTKTRQKILRGLLNSGVPIFIEDCPNHIHVDIDSSIHPLGDAIIAQTG